MRNTPLLCACVLAALVLGPVASGSGPSERSTTYVAAGDLHGTSGNTQVRCMTDIAPTAAELVHRGGDAYALSFVAASACGPIVDSGPGRLDPDGVIRGEGAGGSVWEVRDLRVVPLPTDPARAAVASFDLIVRAPLPLPGVPAGFAAQGTLLGAAVDLRQG